MTIISKFEGRCTSCGEKYKIGEKVEWHRGVKGAKHETMNGCAAARKAAFEARQAALPLDRPTLDLTTIVKFIQGAKDRGLKRPKLRVLNVAGNNELRLSITSSGVAPGSVAVVDHSEGFIGCVRPNGDMTGALALDTQLQTHLSQVALDPAKAAKDYAAVMCVCCFCGKPLTDAGSVEVGYGPICAKHWGLPHTALGTTVLLKVPEAEIMTRSGFMALSTTAVR